MAPSGGSIKLLLAAVLRTSNEVTDGGGGLVATEPEIQKEIGSREILYGRLKINAAK